MKIRMLQTVLGGVDGHWSPNRDDELEVSDPAGALLCKKGIAEPVVEKREEKAVPKKRAEKRA